MFSIIIIPAILISSFVAFFFVESSVRDHDLNLMKETLERKNMEINNLHLQAESDLIFALKNPLFKQYFELADTKNGNIYVDDVLQFSEDQRELKTELEDWVNYFQGKFQIDETCLIDATGQEHLRIVFSQIAPDEELSPDEAESPFFEPSFKKNQDEVHIQRPYISPDSHRKVFAYTSPIVLDSNEKPAFFHFEIPFLVFEDIIRTDSGRIYIIDSKGNIIADSKSQNDLDFTTTQSDTLPSVYSENEYSHLQFLPKLFESKDEFHSMDFNGEQYWYTISPLFTFDWVLVYEKPLSSMLHGDTDLKELQNISLLIAAIFGGGGFIATLFVSIFLAKPIHKLSEECKKIESSEKKTTIKLSTNDEVQDVATTINSMIKELSKKEKLSTVGELGARLAHDMRNPLSVIKNNVKLLKIKTKNEVYKKEGEFTRIDNAIKRMAHQVDEVLDFVREKPLNIEKISLENFMKELISNFKPYKINLKIEPKELSINFDASQMNIAFVNLISNGIYAAGEHGEINIRIKEHSDHINFEIEDSGPGISPEISEKIFEPLFTTLQTGTGLGLASCKRIIESHGGKITFENNPTIFKFTISKNL